MNKEELIQRANEQIRHINDALETRKHYEQRVIQAIAQTRLALSSQQPEQEPQKEESQ